MDPDDWTALVHFLFFWGGVRWGSRVCMPVSMYTHLYAYASMHIHTHLYAYMRVYMHVTVYACTCVHMYSKETHAIDPLHFHDQSAPPAVCIPCYLEKCFPSQCCTGNAPYLHFILWGNTLATNHVHGSDMAGCSAEVLPSSILGLCHLSILNKNHRCFIQILQISACHEMICTSLSRSQCFNILDRFYQGDIGRL